MKIGVCIKQVPSGNARMDSATGSLDRSSSGSAVNPYDRYAIEAALQAAQTLSAASGDQPVEVIAVSMGPPSAEQALREALAMGADSAFLLCDPAFAGSDVSATSRALTGFLKRIGLPDIIFCGQQTTDGDTAQLPFALAAQLNIPALGWVKKIEYFRPNGFSVLQELSGGTVRAGGCYPALFAVGREGLHPRAPNLSRRLEAQKMHVTILGLADLPDGNLKKYGLSGSPTKVRKIYSPDITAKHPPLFLKVSQAAALIREAMEKVVI